MRGRYERECPSLLRITRNLSIPGAEIHLGAIRAQGAGGQHVNKVSSAVHLRFDIRASSLPEPCKRRLLALDDQRITRDGVIVIKAQQHRSLEQNRKAALERLRELIGQALQRRKPRIATRPGPRVRERRLAGKRRRGQDKALRRRPETGEY
jgi:ribosome-associated protein